MDLSFIIPVYNKSENQFRRCISSILKVKDITYEIIVVDDGSSSNMGKIYKEICVNNGLSYYYEKNLGVSAARNYGIKKAKGKYITFVDADDYILPVISKKDLSTHCNLIIFDVKKINTTYNKLYKVKLTNCISNKVFEGKQLLEKTLKDGILNWVVSKVYNRDYLQKNNIYFDTSHVNGEDVDFIVKLLLSNPSTIYVNKMLYVYVYSDVTGLEREKRKLKNNLNDAYYLWALRKNILRKIDLNNSKNISTHIDNEYIKSIFEMYSHIVNDNYKEAKKYKKTFQKFFYKINPQKISMINKLKMIAIEHSWLGLIKNYVQLKKGIKRMISN
ncbi:hypothetical protein GCM10022297_09540 [Lactobacillus hamsteri]|nr:glycosyltransferase [Lactobacillus hamsteri]